MTTTLSTSRRTIGMQWTLPDILDVVEEADQIFNFNNTDDETNDTSYESDDKNNS